MSMETLSMASPRAVRARSVVAECTRGTGSSHRTRHRASLTGAVARVCAERQVVGLSEYLEGVVNGSEGDRAYDHFWSKHDWAHVLRTWSKVADNAEAHPRHGPARRERLAACCGSGSVKQLTLSRRSLTRRRASMSHWVLRPLRSSAMSRPHSTSAKPIDRRHAF